MADAAGQIFGIEDGPALRAQLFGDLATVRAFIIDPDRVALPGSFVVALGHIVGFTIAALELGELGGGADVAKPAGVAGTHELLGRLRMVESGEGEGLHTTNWYRNPEGPQAADLIEALLEQLTRRGDA